MFNLSALYYTALVCVPTLLKGYSNIAVLCTGNGKSLVASRLSERRGSSHHQILQLHDSDICFGKIVSTWLKQVIDLGHLAQTSERFWPPCSNRYRYKIWATLLKQVKDFGHLTQTGTGTGTRSGPLCSNKKDFGHLAEIGKRSWLPGQTGKRFWPPGSNR